MASKHILVVEDEQDIRELVEYNLSREGFTVSCAGCGEDGFFESGAGDGIGGSVLAARRGPGRQPDRD